MTPTNFVLVLEICLSFEDLAYNFYAAEDTKQFAKKAIERFVGGGARIGDPVMEGHL